MTHLLLSHPDAEHRGILLIKEMTTGKVGFTRESGGYGLKLVVEFNDGEVINGSSQRYSPNDRGVFIIYPESPSPFSKGLSAGQVYG